MIMDELQQLLRWYYASGGIGVVLERLEKMDLPPMAMEEIATIRELIEEAKNGH